MLGRYATPLGQCLRHSPNIASLMILQHPASHSPTGAVSLAVALLVAGTLLATQTRAVQHSFAAAVNYTYHVTVPNIANDGP
jgi:hypothetical protein